MSKKIKKLEAQLKEKIKKYHSSRKDSNKLLLSGEIMRLDEELDRLKK